MLQRSSSLLPQSEVSREDPHLCMPESRSYPAAGTSTSGLQPLGLGGIAFCGLQHQSMVFCLAAWIEEGRFLLRCFPVVYFKCRVLGEQEVIRALCALLEQVTGGLCSPLLHQHLSDTFLPLSVCHPGRTEASFKLAEAKCCCRQKLAEGGGSS